MRTSCLHHPPLFFYIFFFPPEIIISSSLKHGTLKPQHWPLYSFPPDSTLTPLNSCWVLNYFVNTLIYFLFFSPQLLLLPPPTLYPNPATKYSRNIQWMGGGGKWHTHKIKQPKSSFPWSSIPILGVNIPPRIFHAQDETREVPCCTIAKWFLLTPLSSFGWQLILPNSAKSALARTRDTGDLPGHTGGPAAGRRELPCRDDFYTYKGGIFIFMYVCVCMYLYINIY